MSKRFFPVAFVIGLVVVAWVAWGFVGTHSLALVMTLAIAAAYLLGAWELRQFRAQTDGLAQALAEVQPLNSLDAWLERVPAPLRAVVRQRVEGHPRALPGPALTPYLVGLLVMLGMLGTFLGMVVTFKGAVFALEGSADLQAMRGALAEPIKGLGLSFGTSVAGVAASAVLGLMSALSRRERMEAARQLDACVAGVLRPFSPAHQREASLQALQAQAGALPQVITQLDSLMSRMEARSRTLDEQLLERQHKFLQETQVAYAALAESVGASLHTSLSASARAAGEAIASVVAGAMAQVVDESQRLHARLAEVAQAQVAELSQQFAGTAQAVSQSWQAALAGHERSSQAQADRLQQALDGFGERFEQRSIGWLQQVQAHLAQAQGHSAEAESQRLAVWRQSLQALTADLQAQWQRAADQAQAQQLSLAQAQQALSTELQAQWQRVAEQAQVQQLSLGQSLQAHAADLQVQWQRAAEQAQAQQLALGQALQAHATDLQTQWQRTTEQAQAQQQSLDQSLQTLVADLQAQWQRAAEQAQAQHLALSQTLEQAAADVARRASEQAGRSIDQAAQLLNRSEELVRSRVDAEAQWHDTQAQRMQALAQLWQTEMQALREAEAQRGQAAVDRLGALEAAVAQHLAQLGASLEAPLSRLLHTAAEVPQAAAGVITQLREEMSRMAERDNLALEERTALLAQLGQLLQAVNQAAGEQRQAIESLVASADRVMQGAGERFAQVLDERAAQATDAAVQLGASAVELASLGEAFGQGVQQFQASSDQLLDGLQRIEAALARSTSRSDEQLAYYVAQAREVIDLSISSQQGILESLQQLKNTPEPMLRLEEGARA